jgi:hypothetical protein
LLKLLKTIKLLHDEPTSLSCSQAIETFSCIDLSAEDSLLFEGSIAEGSIDLIYNLLPAIMGPVYYDQFFKLLDKPKVFEEYRNSLKNQLNKANDDAAALHISVLLLFIREHKCPLYASGKFVPLIVKHAFVENQEIITLLGKALKYVKTKLSAKGVAENSDIMKEVRKLALES